MTALLWCGMKMSLKENRGYESNQGKIWSAVRNISDEVGFHSPTSALHDVYEGKKGISKITWEKSKRRQSKPGW